MAEESKNHQFANKGCILRTSVNLKTGKEHYLYLGDAWEEVTGIPRDTAFADINSFNSAVFPDDAAIVKEYLQADINELTTFGVDVRFKHGNGSVRWLHLSAYPTVTPEEVLWEGFVMDITERKHNELRLKVEKERLEAIGNNFPNGYLYRSSYNLVSKKWRFIYISPRVQELYGLELSTSESDFAKVMALFKEEDLERLRELLRYCLSKKIDLLFEAPLYINGKERWLQISGHFTEEEGGITCDGIVLEVTKRKMAENALRNEKERIEAIGHNIPGGYLYQSTYNTIDKSFIFTYMSGKWADLTGIRVGQTNEDLLLVAKGIGDDGGKKFFSDVFACMETMSDYLYEGPMTMPNGNRLYVQITAHPHRDNELIVWDGIILDITDKKRGEIAIKEAHERFEAIAENCPDGYLYQTVFNTRTNDFRFNYISNQFNEFFGEKQDDTLEYAGRVISCFGEEGCQKFLEAMHHSIATQTDCLIDLPFYPPSGGERIFRITGRPSTKGDITTWNGIVFDITEKRNLELALKAEQERIISIGLNIPSGYLYQMVQDLDTNLYHFEYISPKWKAATGTVLMDKTWSFDELFHRINKEDNQRHYEMIQESIAMGNDYVVEMRYHPDSGAPMRWLRMSSHPTRKGNQIVWDGIMFDITERKLNEMALLASQKRIEAIGENIPDAFMYQIVKDSKTGEYRFTYLTRKWEDVFGEELSYTSEYFKRNIDAFGEKGSKQFMKAVDDSIAMLSNFVFEGPYYLPTGEEIYSRVTGGCHLEGENVVIDGMFFDITEEKRNEQIIARGRRRIEAISENIPDGYLYQAESNSNDEAYFTFMVQKWEDFFGEKTYYNGEYFQKCISCFGEEGTKKYMEATFHSLDTMSPLIYEGPFYLPTGEEKYVRVRALPHPEGDVVKWDGIFFDITEEKRTEQALNAERERVIAIDSNIPNGCIYQSSFNTKTRRYHLTHISHNWEIFSGHTIEETTSDFFHIVHPEDLRTMHTALTKSASTMENVVFEIRIIRKDGDTVWLLISGHPHQENDSVVWDGVVQDITKLKNVEIALRAHQRQLEISTQDLVDRLHEVEESNLRRSITAQIVDMLHTTQNIDDMLPAVLAQIGHFVDADRIFIYEKEKDNAISNTYEWCTSKVIPTKDSAIHQPLERYSGWIEQFERGTFVDNINGLDEELRFDLIKHGLTSIYALPLRSNNELYGFLGFSRYNNPDDFDEKDISLLDGLAKIIATVMERQRTLMLITESEERYRLLVTIQPDAVGVCSRSGEVLYLSPNALRMFRLPEDFKPFNFLEVVHTQERELAQELFTQFVLDDTSYVPCFTLVRSDGTEFYGEVLPAAMKQGGSETTSIMLVVRDITGRRAKEMELIKAKEKAEESDKLKSAFLANMSHEIRTPVNAILGFLKFLANEELERKRQQEYISIATQSSTQLVKLIDDIVDIAKIESNQMAIIPMKIDLEVQLNDIWQNYQMMLESQHRRWFELLLDEEILAKKNQPSSIYVDFVSLRKVLDNLVNNAIKFTKKGYVMFGCRQTLAAGQKLMFYVEDTGIGITPDQQEVIFDSFRQAELNNARKYGGTGLGLSISRSLVRMMGGEIFLDSIPDIGSTFLFTIAYLPVHPTDEELFAGFAPKLNENGPLVEKKLLIATPDIMTFKYYERLLTPTGATVTHVPSIRSWQQLVYTRHYCHAMVATSNFFSGDIDLSQLDTFLPPMLFIKGADEIVPENLAPRCKVVLNFPVTSNDLVEKVVRITNRML